MIMMKPDKMAYSAFEFIKRFRPNLYARLSQMRPTFGRSLQRYARNLLTDEPKAGRIYNFPSLGISNHLASAPGQAPANLTGELRRSIKYSLLGKVDIAFGSTVPYGRILEKGGINGRGHYIAPRPYLSRTFKDIRVAAIIYYTPAIVTIANRYKGFKKH